MHAEFSSCEGAEAKAEAGAEAMGMRNIEEKSRGQWPACVGADDMV